ncbi:MAG: helix-turn-helix domain-containing protein [Desulfurispora sp.]|uniref:helix-turn-helix domain-containing protein n=1 Tax=Desulfurispora sp. TaxID=3014275 RepID=UPI0040497D0A
MSVGLKLRQARERLGLSLEDAENATKIRRKYLEALENEAYQQLPGTVYARGFLRNYARYLGLPGEEMVQEMDRSLAPTGLPGEQSGAREAEPAETRRKQRPAERRPKAGGSQEPAARPVRLRTWIALAGAVLVLLGGWALYAAWQPGKPVPAPTPPVAQKGDKSTLPPSVSPPSVNPAPEGVDLVLNVTDSRSWMQVVVDGREEFTGILQAGEMKQFRGQERIYVKLGNAGVVQVQYNGRNLGVLGGVGQVIKREFTSTGQS